MELNRYNSIGKVMPVCKLLIAGKVRLVQVGGEWMALNYYSERPDRMTNREDRRLWAKTQGLTVTAVEKWVKEARKRADDEWRRAETEKAIATLLAHGYTVTPPEEYQS